MTSDTDRGSWERLGSIPNPDCGMRRRTSLSQRNLYFYRYLRIKSEESRDNR
jgi:hypothetical protein